MSIKKFDKFNEDATATLGNTGGMGAVVAANPSSTAGDVAGSTIGSGDIGQTLGTYTKPMLNLKKKKKDLKKRRNFNNEQNEPYNLMYVVRFSDYNYTKEGRAGIFGWSYPPGAAGDPSAPYNQDDEFYIDFLQYIQDLLIDNDMDEISAERYLDKLDFSDLAEMIDKLIEEKPRPWEPASFDKNDNPIYADNNYTDWERGVRNDNDFKTAQELIKKEKRRLDVEWKKEIAQKIYDKLSAAGFPDNISKLLETFKISSLFGKKSKNDKKSKTDEPISDIGKSREEEEEEIEITEPGFGGKSEDKLVSYLKTHDWITIRKFAKIAKIPFEEASEIIIKFMPFGDRPGIVKLINYVPYWDKSSKQEEHKYALSPDYKKAWELIKKGYLDYKKTKEEQKSWSPERWEEENKKIKDFLDFQTKIPPRGANIDDYREYDPKTGNYKLKNIG